MPSSSKSGKKEIVDWFNKHPIIKTILDIGCGKGTYPKLLGNKYVWLGIEIYEPYVKKYELQRLYQTLILGDCMKVKWPKADCVIFGDVMEHLSKNVIDVILEKAAWYPHMIVSIPLNSKQKAVLGNPHEEHKSIWTWEELNAMFGKEFERKNCGDIAIFMR